MKRRTKMRHLIPYLKKYRLEAIIAPLFKMLEACFDLAVPIIVAKIINQGIKNSDTHFLGLRAALSRSILPRRRPSELRPDCAVSSLKKYRD